MKVAQAVLLLATATLGCGHSQALRAPDEHFQLILASEDNRLAAMLYDHVVKGDLDTLHYESYLAYFRAHEAPSARGVTERIEQADEHFFQGKGANFLLILLYRQEGLLLGDNSATAMIDTVIGFPPGEPPLSLEELARKMHF